MLIRLLCAVMHQGVHLDAGMLVRIDDELAVSWIDRGLAQPASATSSATPETERDPIALAQLEELGALGVPEPVVHIEPPQTDDPTPARHRRRR